MPVQHDECMHGYILCGDDVRKLFDWHFNRRFTLDARSHAAALQLWEQLLG